MCIVLYLPSITAKLLHRFLVLAFIKVKADVEDSRDTEAEGNGGPGHGGPHRVL